MQSSFSSSLSKRSMGSGWQLKMGSVLNPTNRSSLLLSSNPLTQVTPDDLQYYTTTSSSGITNPIFVSSSSGRNSPLFLNSNKEIDRRKSDVNDNDREATESIMFTNCTNSGDVSEKESF